MVARVNALASLVSKPGALGVVLPTDFDGDVVRRKVVVDARWAGCKRVGPSLDLGVCTGQAASMLTQMRVPGRNLEHLQEPLGVSAIPVELPIRRPGAPPGPLEVRHGPDKGCGIPHRHGVRGGDQDRA